MEFFHGCFSLLNVLQVRSHVLRLTPETRTLLPSVECQISFKSKIQDSIWKETVNILVAPWPISATWKEDFLDSFRRSARRNQYCKKVEDIHPSLRWPCAVNFCSLAGLGPLLLSFASDFLSEQCLTTTGKEAHQLVMRRHFPLPSSDQTWLAGKSPRNVFFWLGKSTINSGSYPENHLWLPGMNGLEFPCLMAQSHEIPMKSQWNPGDTLIPWAFFASFRPHFGRSAPSPTQLGGRQACHTSKGSVFSTDHGLTFEDRGKRWKMLRFPEKHRFLVLSRFLASSTWGWPQRVTAGAASDPLADRSPTRMSFADVFQRQVNARKVLGTPLWRGGNHKEGRQFPGFSALLSAERALSEVACHKAAFWTLEICSQPLTQIEWSWTADLLGHFVLASPIMKASRIRQSSSEFVRRPWSIAVDLKRVPLKVFWILLQWRKDAKSLVNARKFLGIPLQRGKP